jgi:hypothetical protein
MDLIWIVAAVVFFVSSLGLVRVLVGLRTEE